MSLIPGRLLVMLTLAGASGFALGSAHELLPLGLAIALLVAAGTACVRLSRQLETPLDPERSQVLSLLACLGATLLGFLLAPLRPLGASLLAGALLAGALLEAAALLPGREALTLSRSLPPRLALGAANEIRVAVTLQGRRALHLEIRDRAPWELLPLGQPGAFRLRPGATAVHRYQVFPPRRSAHRFGAVDLTLTGFPGLVRRRLSLDLPGETHVYPDLRGAAAKALLLHRRRAPLVGVKPARKRGKGTDFESLREYQADDEFRDISWKATARAGKLLVKTFQIEKSQTVMILVEAGRMMSAQVPEEGRPPESWLTRLDHTIAAALVLAQTAALKEDRVGLLAFAEEVKAFLPPKRGRSQLTAIVEALHDLEPTLCEPDYARAFGELIAKAKRRSLVAIFTDLLDPESAHLLGASLPLLIPRHVPLLVAVSDPTVTALARALPGSGVEAFEGAMASEVLAERKDILRSLAARGAQVIDVAPGELSTATVNRYLEIKARNLL